MNLIVGVISVVIVAVTVDAQVTPSVVAEQQVPSSGIKTTTTQKSPPGTSPVQMRYPESITAVEAQTVVGNKVEAAASAARMGKEAERLGDHKAAAAAAIVEGRALEARSTTDAARAYEHALQVSPDSRQQVDARTRLAALRLREGKPEEAVTMLKAIDVSTLDAEQRPIYQYNLGRATENLGEAHANEAFRYYNEALRDRPTYESAIEGAYRSLKQSRNFSQGYDLSLYLVQKGATESAAVGARQLLSIAADPNSQKRMLSAMVQYYAAAGVDEKRFVEQERPFLRKVTADSPSLQSSTAEIEKAYLGKFKAPFDRASARETFPSWSDAQWARDSMSAPLKELGEQRAKAGQWAEALARFSSAFFVDPRRSDAAVDAAALLRDHRELLDSSRALFQQLLEGIFQTKSAYYEEQDWNGIMRLHTVLGTIFEAEKNWGTSGKPDSAIFQWEHALIAEQQLQRSGEKSATVPVLHLKLAYAYEQTGHLSDAQEQYVEASDEFLVQNDREAAASALEKARAAFPSPAPGVRQKMNILQQRLRAPA